jgi:DNA primase
MQDPAPFAAGAAARRTSVDLDSSRQERALLGALIERPALLHILAEELAHLPIGHEELQRLRSGLLDALSLVPTGIEPAADEALDDGPPLESRIIAEHLQHNGLGRLAETARAKAREVFHDDPKESDGWVGQWRRAAQHLIHLTAGPEELRQAEQALAEDMNEENLQRLQAILDRMRRESLESGMG